MHDAVTTSSQDAQAFYDQGAAYLHSYVWVEAARSFNQALRHDGALAMAHLGLSYAYSGLEDLDAAAAALTRAQALAAQISERERRRLAIRVRQLEAIADPKNAHKLLEYRRAIDDALTSDPSDAELWLLRGNAEETNPAGRGQRGGAASIAFYEAALARVPDHFAAHHYLTHTYETIGQIADALRHGEVYARLVPNVPHAQHMYGHDLRRVGRIHEAIERFKRTLELETAYYAAEAIRPEHDWHHVHNLNLLATAYQHQGRMKETQALLQKSFEMPKATEYFETWSKDWPEFLLSRGRIEEALAASRQMAKGRWPATRALGHALSGNALAAISRLDEARAELSAAESEIPRMTAAGPLPATPSAVLPYLHALRGEILLRSGKHQEGAAILKDVARKLRAVHGPDAWTQALFRLELIARVAREAGDWDLAEFMAREMLDHDPAYGGTHYALALVAEQKGNQSVIRTALAEARRLWAQADADLAELVIVRKKLAAAPIFPRPSF